MASLDLDEHGELALDHVVEEPQEVISTTVKKPKKKRDGSTLRKAPQAPKRFKSSYICFFMAKQPEIKDELGDKATVTEISKRSAQMWRSLPPDERAHWDEVAAKDKQRYMVEKASYTGPWQVPWKRAKKDPSAPKRPMSAFLYFSQGKRRTIKDANPSLKNTEVSRLLGEMWRGAPEEERRPHIEKEKEEREKYKVAIADWRKEYEIKMEKERKAQQEQSAYMANMYPAPGADPHQQQQQQPPPNPYGDPNMMGQYPPQQPHSMGPPPPGQGYGYGAPMYPYSYPVSPYQFPTNGKQPVILGPNGTPRYPPPGPASAGYGNAPPGPPPHQHAHHMQQQAPPGPPPPHHAYGGPPPPQQQGYEMQPSQHQHQHQPHHYEYPPPEQAGMEHPPPPPQHPHHQHPHQQHPHHQPQHHHHQE